MVNTVLNINVPKAVVHSKRHSVPITARLTSVCMEVAIMVATDTISTVLNINVQEAVVIAKSLHCQITAYYTMIKKGEML